MSSTHLISNSVNTEHKYNISFLNGSSIDITLPCDNEYSNINNIDKIAGNTNLTNKYSYDYVFTPTYFKSNTNITVTSENSTSQDYSFILQKFPNNIALLSNVIITNVDNINNFNTYDFNYNGKLKKYDQKNLASILKSKKKFNSQ